MNILVSLPDVEHRELALLEIEGIEKLVKKCSTIHYGPVASKRGIVNKIILTIKNALQIRKKVKADQVEVLFLNTAFNKNTLLRDCISLFILKNTGVKVFLKSHGSNVSLLQKGGIVKTLISYLLKNSDAVGLLSSYERNAFADKYSPDKFYVIKNPVNPSLYTKNTEFRSRYNLKDDDVLFLFCSRFIKSKGLLATLEGFKILAEKNSKIHLFCVGDGPEMEAALSFVEKSNLQTQVTFTGFIKEIKTREFYSNCDALVFPTNHNEGFPMVIFQSIAAGMGVITTKIRAAADYLTEPLNVLWIPHDEPKKISEAMDNLFSDRSILLEMQRNNLEKGKEFTTDKNATEYIDIFDRMIAG